MKAETTFRFVSVRPPERNKGKSSTTLGDENATETIKTYVAYTQSRGTVPEKLAETVAEKIVASADYYTKNSDLKPLIEESERFRSILRTSFKNRDPDFFKSKVSDALQFVYGKNIDLEEFAQSQRFFNAKASIWLSYYAIVLSTKTIVGSPSEILEWIRFFGLVEAAVDDKLLGQRLRSYQHLRPSLPGLLLPFLSKHAKKDTVAQKGGAGKTSDKGSVCSGLKRLEEHLHILKIARSELEELFREKIGQARPVKEDSQPGIEELTSMRQEPEQILSWALEENDLKGRSNLSKLMHDRPLDLSSTIPELIQKIDREIASSRSRLFDLQSEEVIIPYGKCLVRVKRNKKFGD